MLCGVIAMTEAWETYIRKYEINHHPNGLAYKYLAFGTSKDYATVFYGHGNTEDEAFKRMLGRAKDAEANQRF